MRRLRLAIVGFGRLGAACAAALRDRGELALAGVVRHRGEPLPDPLRAVEVVTHVRDLPAVDIGLLCVPPTDALAIASELLQTGLPVVECARIEPAMMPAYRAELDRLARRHRVAVVTGAGWDPGVLPQLRRLFEVLVPHGRTVSASHPGTRLHHDAALESIPGVDEALAGEATGDDGMRHRWVYLRLARGADSAAIRQAIVADPLFAGEDTQVLEMPELRSLEATDGLVLERRGTAAKGKHAALALDARFDVAEFAARVMLDAAHGLHLRRPGAHPYSALAADDDSA
jgi:diaminopimelate dehydrogenase